MRVGAVIINQNYGDWERFEAEERGESVPSRPTRSDQDIIREELELAYIADESGFDSIWTVEHHFTPYAMVTNPLQYLTYLAGITKNVDLGTMVTVLPWHNAVRVAEDALMVDILLGEGREVFLGVGRGTAPREFNGLSIDQNEARGRFDEGIQVIKQLFATGACTFDGEFYQIDGMRLRPQPSRDMSANLLAAGGSAATVSVLAENDVRPLIIPTVSLDDSFSVAQSYLQQRNAAGHGGSAYTKLGVFPYVAETQAKAEEGARKYLLGFGDSSGRHYQLGRVKGIKGYEQYEAVFDAVAASGTNNTLTDGFYREHPHGTPDKVIARVTELAETFGTEEMMFTFKYADMSLAEARASMELFVKEVLPALKELEPHPMEMSHA